MNPAASHDSVSHTRPGKVCVYDRIPTVLSAGMGADWCSQKGGGGAVSGEIAVFWGGEWVLYSVVDPNTLNLDTDPEFWLIWIRIQF